MILAVAAVGVAMALGLLLGGSVDRFSRLPLRRRELIWVAAGAQVAAAVGGGPLYPIGLAASAVLVAAFLALNRGLRGTGLLALGLICNAVVVGLNGAMPVSASAAARAGTTTQALRTGRDQRHNLAGPTTRLRRLGDVIPVPFPVRPEVVSAGDVLVAAGLAQLVLVGMQPRLSGQHSRPTRSSGQITYRGGNAVDNQEPLMAKRGRKRRGRKKNAANHGKRPNA